MEFLSKRCFNKLLINFNLTDNVTSVDILNYMISHNFTAGMDYLTAAGGVPIIFGGGVLNQLGDHTYLLHTYSSNQPFYQPLLS